MDGKIIKELREFQNLSQPDLAKLVGVTNGTISFWENGINEPKASYIEKLAEIFNVTTDYLLGRTSDNIFENSYIPKSEIQEVYDELDELEQAQVLSFAQTLAKYKKSSELSKKTNRNIS